MWLAGPVTVSPVVSTLARSKTGPLLATLTRLRVGESEVGALEAKEAALAEPMRARARVTNLKSIVKMCR